MSYAASVIYPSPSCVLALGLCSHLLVAVLLTAYDCVYVHAHHVLIPVSGDNFYTEGVQSTTDELWDTLWREVYVEPYASLRVPWYAVFGNHDYGYGQTGVEAQIARHYTDLDDGLWAMTATNYSK
eukprot:gene33541-43071_t